MENIRILLGYDTRNCSGSAKVDGICVPINSGTTIGITHTNIMIIDPQNIIVVWAAAHPPVERVKRGGVITGVNIFTPPTPDITRQDHALPGSRTVRAGMRNKIIDCHIGAVNASGSHQGTVDGQCWQPVGNPLFVDQSDDLVFVTAVVYWHAGRGG